MKATTLLSFRRSARIVAGGAPPTKPDARSRSEGPIRGTPTAVDNSPDGRNRRSSSRDSYRLDVAPSAVDNHPAMRAGDVWHVTPPGDAYGSAAGCSASVRRLPPRRHPTAAGSGCGALLIHSLDARDFGSATALEAPAWPRIRARVADSAPITVLWKAAVHGQRRRLSGTPGARKRGSPDDHGDEDPRITHPFHDDPDEQPAGSRAPDEQPHPTRDPSFPPPAFPARVPHRRRGPSRRASSVAVRRRSTARRPGQAR